MEHSVLQWAIIRYERQRDEIKRVRMSSVVHMWPSFELMDISVLQATFIHL